MARNAPFLLASRQKCSLNREQKSPKATEVRETNRRKGAFCTNQMGLTGHICKPDTYRLTS
jgi:hypothetical protein